MFLRALSRFMPCTRKFTNDFQIWIGRIDKTLCNYDMVHTTEKASEIFEI